MPKAYSLTYTDTDKAIAFLTDVIQLDLTQYQPVVKHVGPINTSYLVNMSLIKPSSMEPSYDVQVNIQLEPDVHLSPVGTSAGFHCIMWFSNGTPFYFSISGVRSNTTIHYTHPQPSTALDTSKEMLQRYQTYLAQYCGVDGSYLQPMITMINSVAEPVSTVQVSDNVQMKIDYETVLRTNATKTNIRWDYVNNGVTVTRKHISLDFPNGTISHFMDTWNLFTVGTWNMISKEEALDMAFSAAKDVTFKFVNSSGQTYEIKPELSNSASASLSMLPRGNNELYPFWYIEILCAKSYGNVVGVQVGIWADTKEIIYCQELGYLGSMLPDDSSKATPAFPELSWLIILPLLLAVISVAVILRHQKQAKKILIKPSVHIKISSRQIRYKIFQINWKRSICDKAG